MDWHSLRDASYGIAPTIFQTEVRASIPPALFLRTATGFCSPAQVSSFYKDNSNLFSNVVCPFYPYFGVTPNSFNGSLTCENRNIIYSKDLTIPPGNLCLNSTECYKGSCVNGTCVSNFSQGSNCSIQFDCPETKACNLTSNQCMPKFSIGASCNS